MSSPNCICPQRLAFGCYVLRQNPVGYPLRHPECVLDAYLRRIDVEYTIVDEEKLKSWLTQNEQTRFDLL